MAITDKCGYKNIWAVFVSIYTKEKTTRALFRGYIASIVGVVPYAGTSFFTNETLKQKYCGNISFLTNDSKVLIKLTKSL